MAPTRRNWGYVFWHAELHLWCGIVYAPGSREIYHRDHWQEAFDITYDEVRKAHERLSAGD